MIDKEMIDDIVKGLRPTSIAEHYGINDDDWVKMQNKILASICSFING